MASRFRLFDNGGKSADRYTLIDCKRKLYNGRAVYDYFAFDENPTHPQGFGATADIRPEHYYGLLDTAGKRISLLDLPPEAQAAARRFLKECGASKAAVETLERKYRRTK